MGRQPSVGFHPWNRVNGTANRTSAEAVPSIANKKEAAKVAEKKTGFDFDGWTWAHYVCEITPPEMLSMKARLALLILARHCNPTHQCFIGLDRLARMMGASENSAREGNRPANSSGAI